LLRAALNFAPASLERDVFSSSSRFQRLARCVRRSSDLRPKSNPDDPICFGPYVYRARNPVERFFNRIKQCRRVATRYDKLAANDLAFVELASIRLWLAAR
jgi:transposase